MGGEPGTAIPVAGSGTGRVSMPDSAESTAAAILVKLGEMGAQLAVIGEQLKSIPDHEQRIRKLEAARWPLPTVAAISAVIAAAAALAAYIHH